MRRKDREVTDLNEIYAIVKKCRVCSIALHNKDFPYIVPMNFGVSFNGSDFIIYFHSSNAGTKLELIRNNENSAFEMHTSENLILGETACESTMEYESVCGTGKINIVSDDEKINALTLIMKQYSKADNFHFDEKEVSAVTILKMNVLNISGKRLKRN